MKVLALGLGLGLAPSFAMAADPSLCKALAREVVRIGYLHNLQVVANSKASKEEKDKAAKLGAADRLPFLLARNYAICLNAEDDIPFPPSPLASDDEWLQFVLRQEFVDQVITNPGKEQWCAENYASYNPETGTVLRRGVKGRVLCPYEEVKK